MILTTGTRLCQQFGHATWTTPPLSEPRKAETASKKLRGVRGVIAAEVEPDRRIRIEYDRERIQKAELRGVLALMGIQVEQ